MIHPLQQLNPFDSFCTTLIPESYESVILTLLISFCCEFLYTIDWLNYDIFSLFCCILSANDDLY